MFKLISLITVLFTFSAQGFKLWPFTEENTNQLLRNELNNQIVGDEQIQKGASITPNIQSEIKGYIQAAFIYSGSDYWKNVAWIQSKLNQAYPGDWMITMFNSTSNTSIIPNQTFGVSSYSLNGSWWIYWRGGNHYQPSLAYYLSRQGGNTQNITTPFCHSLNNMSYYYTDTFKNIVTAVESDVDALMTEAYQIQLYLKQFNPNMGANVLVSKRLPFFSCQWGIRDSNYWQMTPARGNTVISFPRI